MAHEFLIKDIAYQAGLSVATVDRVIHKRGGVRRQTHARIEAALEELRQQDNAAPMAGRRFVIDMVMEAPDRFTSAVRHAFEAEAATFLPTVFRCRFHFVEQMRQSDMVKLLEKIRRRGSHGVVLKAPDTPAVNAVVGQLEEARIPVVTLVTDVSHSPRSAYAGSDNRAAGETAAYLIGEKLGQQTGRVLVTLSSNRFRGEEEREIGFRRLLRERYPKVRVTEVSEGYGRDTTTATLAASALRNEPAINAVYSIGGANRAILSAFVSAGRSCICFVAHDLDNDNLALLREHRIHYVLHHDLRSDAASAYRTLLKFHHALPGIKGPGLSALEIITPYNIPHTVASTAQSLLKA